MNRKYTETEVRQILGRAVDAGSGEVPDSGSGLTLQEIKEIGVEVGIDPAHVERAAVRSSDRPRVVGSPWPARRRRWSSSARYREGSTGRRRERSWPAGLVGLFASIIGFIQAADGGNEIGVVFFVALMPILLLALRAVFRPLAGAELARLERVTDGLAALLGGCGAQGEHRRGDAHEVE